MDHSEETQNKEETTGSLKEQKKTLLSTLFQFIRFNLVGGINTGLTYLIFSGVYFLSESRLIALIADYAFGILFSFFANRYFTFKVKDREHVYQFLKMILSYGILFVLNYFLLRFLSETLNWNMYLAQLLTLVVVVFISFFVQKFFVFSKKLFDKRHKKEN